MSNKKSPPSDEQAIEILRKIDKLNAQRRSLDMVKEHIDMQLMMINANVVRLQDKLNPGEAEILTSNL